MRVVVDRTVCQGVGMCESFAPEVFEIGDDGVVTIDERQMAAVAPDVLQQAVDGCPTLALSVRQV